jgi:dolichol-phosphate mannosyltransferase
MDSDLQDDPKEIPRFLAMLDEGFDFVCGWKKNRNDPLSKTVPSALFNAVVRLVTGITLHDFNCCFKAGLTEACRSIPLYGDLHRYIPVFVHNLGYRVGELAVDHRARRYGRSKYGMERFVRGFLDLLTVATITRFRSRPSHLFGGIGALLGATGTAILLYLLGVKLFTEQIIGDRPLVLLGVLLQIISVQFIFFGVLAELIINRGWSAGDAVSPVAEAHERRSISPN